MIKRIIPPKLKLILSKYTELLPLKLSGDQHYDVKNLRISTVEELKNIWNSEHLLKIWNQNKDKINSLRLPELTGGVNAGDQRAIFYFTSYLKPKRVLEIGTHIGCSTLSMALALKAIKYSTITSVDIIDVNNEKKKRWLKFGGKYSPKELTAKAEFAGVAEFRQMNSIEFLKTSDQKFDFIFLDGSHKAIDVYREIPLAVQLLNENGIILLHDYYPNSEPIWSDNVVIPGPYMAVKRLMKENELLEVRPFGELPWKTKLNSSFTSLALLTKKDVM